MTRSVAGAKLAALAAEISTCRRCPRLVAWRERVAREKRRMYADETYWGRPVPGFGDPRARLVVVGLAPAAHGANRTGRMFTGDRSGDFLYAALPRRGLASIPTSASRDDGQRLSGVFITSACRCAPPDNQPTPLELDTCRPWLAAELALLSEARVYLALGRIGYLAVLTLVRGAARAARVAAPPFGHGAEARVPDPRGARADATLVASYHPSQQNTQTGRLTRAMFDRVLDRAAAAAGL
ncbi:MAG TPA: uracil-DNA glycosylase [Minicystis sp.]|nr:uracil-DNA glycosylase [Minicystis sp.]